MPRVGKMGPGRLLALLKEIQPHTEEARVELLSPQETATLHIRHGQIEQFVHEHHRMNSVLSQVNTWKQGLFCIYKPQEKQERDRAPVFFLLSDQQQSQELHQAMITFDYPLWFLDNLHEFMELYNHYRPILVVGVPETLSSLPPSLLTKPQEPGQSPVAWLRLDTTPPQNLPSPLLALPALTWPCPLEQLQQAIRSFLPPTPPPVLSTPSPLPSVAAAPSATTDNKFTELLAAITPHIPKDLGCYVHPLHRHTIENLAVAEEWRQWLLSLDHAVPFSHYLTQSPGTPEQTDILVRYLLHLGILTTHRALYSMLAPPPSSPQPTSATEPRLQITKIVTLGLRGQWKEDWIFSLQQISQQMSLRVPRNPSIHIPHLPKTEHARIPLPNNTLLLFYGMLHEENVETLLGKMGGNLDALLFFVDVSRETEVYHAQDMRKRLLQQYHVPSVVMLTQLGQAPNVGDIEQFKLSAQDQIVPLRQLDEPTTHQVLYQLLQQFPQHRGIMPPPSS